MAPILLRRSFAFSTSVTPPLQHLAPGTMPFTPCVEFGAMDLSDYDSDQDADYSPSEGDSEDSIEYDSEAEVSEVSEVDEEISEEEVSEEEVEERTAEVVEA